MIEKIKCKKQMGEKVISNLPVEPVGVKPTDGFKISKDDVPELSFPLQQTQLECI